MAYSDPNGDPGLMKIETEDGLLKELQYKTEKHDFENLLKSPKNDKVIIERNIKVFKKIIYFRVFNRKWLY